MVVDEDMPWVIFDIDGTLANIDHRLHHITGDKKDWDEFSNWMHLDRLKEDIYALYMMCKFSGYNIMVVTGRFERYRSITEEWLKLRGITFKHLYMRPDGDYSPDYEIKQRILDEHIADKKVLFAVDDRDRVVEMWRSNNITCLQVQKGDY